MAANALEHKPPWKMDAVFTTCDQRRAPTVQHKHTGGLPFQFHDTAGKSHGATEEELHGCMDIASVDPFCSAGSYLSINREDSKYQHLSQRTSFSFAALLPAVTNTSGGFLLLSERQLQGLCFTDLCKCRIS